MRHMPCRMGHGSQPVERETASQGTVLTDPPGWPTTAMIAHRGEAKKAGYLYVIHFINALATGRKYSQHYVGYAHRDWPRRIQQHRNGLGARIMREVQDRGLHWRVAVVVDVIAVGELEITGREMEAYIKRQHNHRRYCPLCGSTRLTDYREG